MTIKILSINARGIQSEKKRRALFDKHRFNVDILIMQETHSTIEDEKIWQNEWGGIAYFSHGTSQARGVLILATKEAAQNIDNVHKDHEGRTLIFDITQNGKAITVAAVYAPNQDTPEFFSKLSKVLRARTRTKDHNWGFQSDIRRRDG